MNYRVAPAAVCRTLLENLDIHKRLNDNEQAEVLIALAKTGIKVERVLADLSRNTIRRVLSEM